jgi:iron-sulfur cluster repair protein YtfE (RIC family)
MVTSDVTVGRIAAEHPLATRVFARHQIDYCCGGGRPLEEVCAAKGLDADAVLREIATEIGPAASEDHMLKEEQIQFPMIRRGHGAGANGPVAVMLREHTEAGAALARLRELTDGYVAPEGACNTWRALYAGLAALETDLHEHIHLENNILFPRALAG